MPFTVLRITFSSLDFGAPQVYRVWTCAPAVVDEVVCLHLHRGTSVRLPLACYSCEKGGKRAVESCISKETSERAADSTRDSEERGCGWLAIALMFSLAISFCVASTPFFGDSQNSVHGMRGVSTEAERIDQRGLQKLPAFSWRRSKSKGGQGYEGQRRLRVRKRTYAFAVCTRSLESSQMARTGLVVSITIHSSCSSCPLTNDCPLRVDLVLRLDGGVIDQALSTADHATHRRQAARRRSGCSCVLSDFRVPCDGVSSTRRSYREVESPRKFRKLGWT